MFQSRFLKIANNAGYSMYSIKIKAPNRFNLNRQGWSKLQSILNQADVTSLTDLLNSLKTQGKITDFKIEEEASGGIESITRYLKEHYV